MKEFQAIKEMIGIEDEDKEGFSEIEISNVEKRIGKLPKLLEDYYLELGKHEINYVFHQMVLSEDLEFFKNSDMSLEKYDDDENKDKYLLFWEESAGVCSWGIKQSDMRLEDPPMKMEMLYGQSLMRVICLHYLFF